MTPASADGDRSALADICSELRLPASDLQIDRLVRYLDLLQRWNAAYNLTSVRDRAAMLTQHLADCLAVVHPVRRLLPAGRVLDVGSGGGLPGVVLAVMTPDLDVTCVDAVGKKAAFIRQCVGELGLGNARAVQSRVEALPEGYDLIVARAFASLVDLVKVTRGRLAPGGAWLAMKGRRPVDEMEELPGDVTVFHVEQLHVPRLAAERWLIGLRPADATGTRSN